MAARRILLIEDEPAARDGLARLLADEGFLVRTVGSGHAAIEQLGRLRPDTVVCDFYLSDLTGLQVLRAVRSSANFPVTFIVITAGCGGAEMEETLRREADFFLQKPLDLDLLCRVLRQDPPIRIVRAAIDAST
jgi:CheY-like chemotaxis protein